MGFFKWIQAVDLSAVQLVREHLSCPFLDSLMRVITLAGEEGILWIAVAIALLCFRKTRKAGFVMALSMIMGLLVGNLTLKPLISRPRPYAVDGSSIIIPALSDYSFPSGHTLVCFEAAVSLCLSGYKKMGTAALVLAFAVAFSRIYLYVHYPTDVITGAILGSLFAFLSFVIVGKLYEKCKKSKTL